MRTLVVASLAIALLAGCAGSSNTNAPAATKASMTVQGATLHDKQFCFTAADGQRYDTGDAKACLVLRVDAFCEAQCTRWTGWSYYVISDGSKPPRPPTWNPHAMNGVEGDCARSKTCHMTLYFPGEATTDWSIFKVLSNKGAIQGDTPLDASLPALS